uniref:Putative ovule protein n=1 Tax=Solanum chacoense TaxID=4108 RepID=A0A0V0IHT5_SOLCH
MNQDVNIKLRVIVASCLSSWIVLLMFVLIPYMVCSGRMHFQKQSLSSPFPDCNILCFFFLTLFSNRMPIVHFFSFFRCGSLEDLCAILLLSTSIGKIFSS